MGQPIDVVKKPGSRPGLVRFETNRWLTGMGHERYTGPEDIVDDKTVDDLARRLFATGDVRTVHVSGSVLTVELASEDADTDGLLEVIRNLHIYYGGANGASGEPGADAPEVGGASGEPAGAGSDAPA